MSSSALGAIRTVGGRWQSPRHGVMMVRSTDVSIRGSEAMSAADVEALERIPMSLEDFLALPEGVRAEWVDGIAIVNAQPTRGHNKVAMRVASLLERSLPGTDVTVEPGVHTTDRRRYRVPDVAVFGKFEDVHWTDQVPILVVEVLSPGTRGEDLVRKAHEYAESGVGQYWVVDREARRITVYTRNGTGWDVLLELTDATPRGEAAVGDRGVVALDLPALLKL